MWGSGVWGVGVGWKAFRAVYVCTCAPCLRGRSSAHTANSRGGAPERAAAIAIPREEGGRKLRQWIEGEKGEARRGEGNSEINIMPFITLLSAQIAE